MHRLEFVAGGHRLSAWSWGRIDGTRPVVVMLHGGLVFDLVRDYNTNITIDSSKELCEKALELIRSLGAPLGMLQKQTKKESLEDEIESLIEQRQEARKNRDFALADKIRDDLKARGIVLIDTPQGVRWKKEN